MIIFHAYMHEKIQNGNLDICFLLHSSWQALISFDKNVLNSYNDERRMVAFLTKERY